MCFRLYFIFFSNVKSITFPNAKNAYLYNSDLRNYFQIKFQIDHVNRKIIPAALLCSEIPIFNRTFDQSAFCNKDSEMLPILNQILNKMSQNLIFNRANI